jgi:chemotaxis protein MotB
MGVDDRPIIIIKKSGGHEGGHHGGAWKVAYADFVTAMMAFFLVMWILGMSSNDRKAIAAYFNDPTGFMKTMGGGQNPMMPWRQAPTGAASLLPGMQALLSDRSDNESLKRAKTALKKMLSSRPEFRELRKHIEVTITAEGLRIELLEDGKGPLFFRTGSAQLETGTPRLLTLIGRELRRLPNDISIEGHTDSRPYAGGQLSYSNWELSTDRANSARRVLQTVVKARQIGEVRGLADRSLRVPDDPMHYSNRRVSILVQKRKIDVGNVIERDPAKPGQVDLVNPPAEPVDPDAPTSLIH